MYPLIQEYTLNHIPLGYWGWEYHTCLGLFLKGAIMKQKSILFSLVTSNFKVQTKEYGKAWGL